MDMRVRMHCFMKPTSGCCLWLKNWWFHNEFGCEIQCAIPLNAPNLQACLVNWWSATKSLESASCRFWLWFCLPWNNLWMTSKGSKIFMVTTVGKVAWIVFMSSWWFGLLEIVGISTSQVWDSNVKVPYPQEDSTYRSATYCENFGGRTNHRCLVNNGKSIYISFVVVAS